VWVLGRIYCTGTPEDYKAVHALQDQVSAVPLSAYGKPYTPAPGKVDAAIDMKLAPREQVNAMDGAAYFKLFAELLKTNPPAAEDAPMVAKLAKIGLVPGQDFDASKLDPAVAKGIAAAPKPAQEKVSDLKEAILAGHAKVEHGWMFFPKTGVYGTGYRNRALITWYGLGANRPQDAVYPTPKDRNCWRSTAARTSTQCASRKATAAREGFWSITMYDDQYFFVPNRSTATRSAAATSSRPIRTVRSMSMSRTSRRARTRSRTGCPRRRGVRADDAAVLAQRNAAVDP